MSEFISRSEGETEALGARLAAGLPGGAVVAMYGDLGAGKTAFVRGMARGMGLNCRVSSPTFTIVNRRGRAVRYRVGGLSRPRRGLRGGVERECGGRLFRGRDPRHDREALRYGA